MKRNIFILLFSLFAFCLVGKSYANDSRQHLQHKLALMTDEQKTSRLSEIKARIEEIQTMDKSNLSTDDRKALRQELRNMGKEAKAIENRSIYISFGATVAVIGLLIVLL